MKIHRIVRYVFVLWVLAASAPAGGPGLRALDPVWGLGERPATGDRLRVVCYNIENFSDGSTADSRRTPAIASVHARDAAALLDRFVPDADIVVLQEIKNAEALQLLNHAFSRPFPAGYISDYRTPSGRRVPLNNAVLVRVATDEVVEGCFGRMEGDVIPTRGFVRVRLRLPGGGALVVYTAHLKSNYGNADRNRAQRLAATRAIRADADALLGAAGGSGIEFLITGDFNTDPDDAQFADDSTLDPFKDWSDLWRGRPIDERVTCPTRYGDPAREFRPIAFDRVIVTPGLTRPPWMAGNLRRLAEGVNTQDVYALPGTGRGHVSDHYPVAVDLVR